MPTPYWEYKLKCVYCEAEVVRYHRLKRTICKNCKKKKATEKYLEKKNEQDKGQRPIGK